MPRTSAAGLSQVLSEFIPKKIRGRGRSIFTSGALTDVKGGSNFVSAVANGTRNYEVMLVHDREGLRVTCGCDFFLERGDICKHIWAAVLAADAGGYISNTRKVAQSLRMWGVQSADLDEIADAQQQVEDEGGSDADDDLESDEDDAAPDVSITIRRPINSREGLADRLKGAPPAATLAWERIVDHVGRQGYQPVSDERQILYTIERDSSRRRGSPVVSIQQRERRLSGQWGGHRAFHLHRFDLNSFSDPVDQRIAAMLFGAETVFGGARSYMGGVFVLEPPAFAEAVLREMCATGRCALLDTNASNGLLPLSWDDGVPWHLRFSLRPSGTEAYELRAFLQREEQRVELPSSDVLMFKGLLVHEGRLSSLQDAGAEALLKLLEQEGFSVPIPKAAAEKVVASILTAPIPPSLALPDELAPTETIGSPQPRLAIISPGDSLSARRGWVNADLSFDYGGIEFRACDRKGGHFDAARRRLVSRSWKDEMEAQALLRELEIHSIARWQLREATHQFPQNRFSEIVRRLTSEGWRVEADGRTLRTSGSIDITVTSGIDWFELHGEVSYDGQSITLPELLQAVRKGETTVQLGDGSYGMLPEEWLKKYYLLTELGQAEDDHVRFKPSQVAMLDALLAAQPEARWDEQFEHARQRLKQFDSIAPASPVGGFQGTLRDYQKLGLAWLQFLQEFGLGGCLADDMGLGKTVQVLALLAGRRHAAPAAGSNGSNGALNGNGTKAHGMTGQPSSSYPPSLIVMPRSLLYNWAQEAQRFTPDLRVLDCTGTGRPRDPEAFNEYDIILTTYGTMRADVARLIDFEFDYVVLDEAQAIKNPSTAAAKAARLLKARHRLALSGTPVENHVGELFSLMQFLNPGMLGRVSALPHQTRGQLDEGTLKLLGRALRPVILRRTKSQVARDLPERHEQTVYCELEKKQRKLYDELREHYRASLLKQVDVQGLNKSKMHVLEALLRLRQAACHPALIDSKRRRDPSAKLDLLMEHVTEVASEGHKALVFSQFTSMLDLVRQRLDRAKIVHEYLDGQTTDRGARVEHFQNDPECPLFLISLKAGGLGLNLTAAEYVFLLDPWWNPAVEAQAIDRAHRIGQTRQVFAYRLIARDTVEEKVLELQDRKRELADAIINADNSLLRGLTREDLELLLS